MGLKNKRGMFFTLIAIALISLLLVSYAFISEAQKRRSTQERVESMNDFISSVEKDIPRHLYILGFRTIFLIEQEIAETGTYFPEVDSTLKEAFYNETFMTEESLILEGASLSDFLSKVNESSIKRNIEFNFHDSDIEILQVDPWNVKISLEANLFFKDKNNIASWNITKDFAAFIPIQGFEDPLYIVNTRGAFTNIINQTPYDSFIDGEDVSNLLDHATNSYYASSSSAPSFLERLEGTNNPSPYGIESFVNLQKLSAAGIDAKDKSVVDFIYFSTQNPAANPVSGMPSWFKIDADTLSRYN